MIKEEKIVHCWNNFPSFNPIYRIYTSLYRVNIDGLIPLFFIQIIKYYIVERD